MRTNRNRKRVSPLVFRLVKNLLSVAGDTHRLVRGLIGAIPPELIIAILVLIIVVTTKMFELGCFDGLLHQHL